MNTTPPVLKTVTEVEGSLRERRAQDCLETAEAGVVRTAP